MNKIWVCLFKDGTADWWAEEKVPPAEAYVRYDDIELKLNEKNAALQRCLEALNILPEDCLDYVTEANHYGEWERWPRINELMSQIRNAMANE